MSKDNNMVLVDYELLRSGLEFINAGLLRLADAVAAGNCKEAGAELADALKKPVIETAKVAEKVAAGEVKSPVQKAEKADQSENAEIVPMTQASASQTSATQPDVNPDTKTGPDAITQEDVIKLITRKIEADRSNSPKIGELIKTYGVETLKELPAEKYEEFLTKLAAL